MAAVKLSFKRGRDEMEIAPPCSPAFVSPSLPKKRARMEPLQGSPSPSRPHFRQNFFPSHDVQKEVSEALPEILRTSKKRKMPSEEKLFTYDEVKEIVSRALYVKEDQLREEYNQILFERLQEQFHGFVRYNEDCISRQMKESDFSYMS